MSKDMKRESILFYRSFYEAICGLPKDIQLEIYNAIMEYGLNGNLPEDLKPVAKGMFALMKPIIDSNNARAENGKKGAEFGKRGGRPRNQKATLQEQPLTFEQEIEQMKADTEWAASVCKDYSLTPDQFAAMLARFIEHCRKNRNGKPHDNLDDAKSHPRYWLDKTPARQPQPTSHNPQPTNIPPDYGFNGGFGGQDT